MKIVFIIILASFFSNSWASNKQRENNFAEKISSSLIMGEVVWLKEGDSQFLSLYSETEEIENRGTVIILHSMGGHANQKKIVAPIRTFLPKHNWATLSLQMPVLEIGATRQEYFSLFEKASDRIQSGVDYLLAAEAKNIVLIGYGLGGMMAINYLQKKSEEKEIKALITIALAVPSSDHKQAQVLDFIPMIKQPFLDIFAEFNLPEVTDTARKRKLAGKVNLAYRQFQIEGEGYLFQDYQGLLVKRIYSWISRTLK